MSAKQSALDQILVIFLPSDYPKWSERADLVIRARDELDQLLSRSNELDMLQKSPNKILKNCPACHYEYDTDICPECGWPRTAINSKKHGIDDLIEYAEDGGRFIWLDEAITELAQLRAAAAELQAAHVYLDESYINDPNDPPLELADRCAQLVKTISEQARQIEDARISILEVSIGAVETDRDDLVIMFKWIRDKCTAWLAANPAPRSRQHDALRRHC